MRRRLCGATTGLVVALSTAPASATDCSPPGGLSPCVDSNNLWMPAGVAHFAAIAASETVAPGAFGFGLGLTYFTKPIVLVASSPDPAGREVNVVDDVLDASFMWAYGLAPRVELSAVLPVALRQSGSGVEGVTSQSAPPIRRTAVRDPRFGGAFALLPRAPGRPVGSKARLDLSVPMGDEAFLAGVEGFSLAPSVLADVVAGPAFAALEIGARLRRRATIAGATIGHQGFVGLGVGAHLVGRELLSLTAEVWALPSLVSQTATLPGGDRVTGGRLMPAEWFVGVRSAPLRSGDLALQAGAGTGLPLSNETRAFAAGGSDSDSFAAVTTPAFRAVLSIRYAPIGRDTDADGVPDEDDRCPAQPEDRDGFEDADGCPDRDNDLDGIDDEVDRCRDAAETVDGHEDEDGCPDPDDDGDGVPDADDRCRMEPEDRDGIEDGDGCPEHPAASAPPPEPPADPDAPGPAPPAGPTPPSDPPTGE